jgi:hypothetical protein
MKILAFNIIGILALGINLATAATFPNRFVTNDDATAASLVRLRATNSFTYFVATTGSDANSGLTIGAPLLTIQAAVNKATSFDFGTNNITVQVADGSYSGSVLVTKMVANTDWKANQGILFIHGNDASPASVTITNATTNHLVMASQGSTVILGSLTVGATNQANLNLLDVQLYSTLAISNVVIGPTTNGSPQIVSESFGHFYTKGPVTVTKGASALINVLGPADAWLTQTITFTGSPAYTVAALYIQGGGSVYITGASFSGTVTGSKYAVFNGGTINTLGGASADTLAIGNSSGSSGLGLIEGATNIFFGTWQLNTNGIVGAANGGSAMAGIVGEFTNRLVAFAGALPLLNVIPTNISSVTLSAGDWDVTGAVVFSGTTATSTRSEACITSTSNSMNIDGSQVYSALSEVAVSFTDSVTVPRQRFSVSTSTTIYITGESSFSAGSVSAYGQISARRVR